MKRKIVILQDNAEALASLVTDFSKDEDFDVIGCFTDGMQALSLIMKEHIDYLVTDIVLSGIDGISFIERVKDLNPDVRCVVVSAFSRDELVSLAIKKGAIFYMVRPIDYKYLKVRLTDTDIIQNVGLTVSPANQHRLEEKVSNVFINVGIPPHIKGYNYLREGVIMAVNNPSIINSITKKLYPGIGEKYNTTPSKVERAIRHAIEVAWNRGRIEVINNLFGVKAYNSKEKSTNGEFIALVADKMLLEMV